MKRSKKLWVVLLIGAALGGSALLLKDQPFLAGLRGQGKAGLDLDSEDALDEASDSLPSGLGGEGSVPEGKPILVAAGEKKENLAAAEKLGWRFERDADGLVLASVDPAGRRTTIKRETDPKTKTTRVVREWADGTKLEQEFDRFSRPIWRRDATGVVKYEYDGFGRLHAVRPEKGPALVYDYDGFHRLRSLKVGEEFSLKYTYDLLGRLEKIETPAGAIQYSRQTASGTLERKLPNGVRTRWRHQPGGLLDSITHVGPDDLIMVQFSYSYRPDGLISQIKQKFGTEPERIIDYTYDPGRKLIGVLDSRTKLKTTYRYDPFGNRIEVGEGEDKIETAYDWASRVKKHHGEPCGHDAAGNVTEYLGWKGKTTLKYGVTDLVRSIETPAGKVNYEYDGENNLIARSVGAKKTTFVPDPSAAIWRPLLAREEGGSATYFLWDGATPLGEIRGDQFLFYLEDHLGTVTHQVDGAGKVVDSTRFDPFGTPKTLGEGDALRPGFCGLFLDPLAGVYLTRERAYAPDLARFLQRDPEHRMPLGSPKDLSTYAYCGGDPVNFRDTDGARPVRSGGGSFFWRPIPAPRPRSDFRPGPGPGTEPFPGAPILPPAPVLVDPGAKAGLDLVGDYFEYMSRLETMKTLFPPGSASPPSSGPVLSPARPDAWRGEIVGGPEPVIDDVGPFSVRSDRYRLRGGGTITVPVVPGDPRPIRYEPAPGETKPDPSSGAPFGLPGFGPGLPLGGPVTDSDFRPRLGMDDGMSKVGGVALKGAGKMLEGIGQLQGIALDANGRLVLISQERGDLELPPLRLDDVVTIFRGVYEHGEAPWVSIDPDEKAPYGPKMNTRLPKSATDTYVGWVLFETDRLMKTYRQGEDNITRKAVHLGIAGYKETLELRFKPGKKGPEHSWNWFWITPLTTSRLQAEGGKITLVEVPMQLLNAFEILKEGKLVPSGLPSPHDAEAYCKWFTNHFEDLARTVRVRPPVESGIEGDVLVFAELQRMALIAAMAEALRDQGVPMPAWMLDYPVQPCPVPATTPTLTTVVKRKIDKTDWTFRLFGGAVLSPPSDLIKTIKEAPKARQLYPRVQEAMAGAPLLTPVSFTSEGKTFKAVALPGDDTQGFGALQVVETDLAVPLKDGLALKLTRFFNSFHEPRDVLGTGWTLDLPRLHRQIYTYDRKEKGSKTRWTYHLTSPLGTHAESFFEEREVPELGGKYLVPRHKGGILALYFREGKPIVGFRNGNEWHFDKTGRLEEVRAGTLRIRYHWTEAGRLEKIEGASGLTKAHIALEYDEKGRLRAAHGSSKESARYHYVGAFLDHVEGGSGPVNYKYEEGRLLEVAVKDKVTRRFEYDPAGKLAREVRGDVAIVKEVRSDKEGTEVRTFRGADKEPAEITKYDPLLRPVHRALADGTTLKWHHGADGAEDLEAKLADGTGWTLKKKVDGTGTLTHRLAEGGTMKVEADAGGRITGIWLGDQPVVEHTYRSDGLLKSVKADGGELFPYYTKEGALESIFLGGHKKPDGKFASWVDVKCDAEGRPLKLKDQWGMEVTLGYDPEGRLASWSSKRGKMELERDRKGRLIKVITSWGETQINTFDPASGALVKREWVRDGDTSWAEYKDGKLTRLREFDGTETTYGLGADGKLREIHTPDGLTLRYREEGPDTLVVECGDRYEVRYRFDDAGRILSMEERPIGK